MLSPCRITFKFLNQALRYNHYHINIPKTFDERPVHEENLMEYLRTCCFSKNVTFNAIEAFEQGQEYHGPDGWQKYEDFGIDILDFADTSCICYTWASRNTL